MGRQQPGESVGNEAVPGIVREGNVGFAIVDKVGDKNVASEDELADTEALASVEIQAVAEHRADLGVMAETGYMEQCWMEVLDSVLALAVVVAQQTGLGVVS